MKPFLLLSICCLLSSLFYTGCKKDKSKCGCNNDVITNIIIDFDGELAYNNYNNKWYVFYLQDPGSYFSFYACNAFHLQLRNIIIGADKSRTYKVKFSGKVKEPCAGESFGWTNTIVINNYIIIDSIKLN